MMMVLLIEGSQYWVFNNDPCTVSLEFLYRVVLCSRAVTAVFFMPVGNHRNVKNTIINKFWCSSHLRSSTRLCREWEVVVAELEDITQ